jgi:two-component system, NarL family, response regulator LiaR
MEHVAGMRPLIEVVVADDDALARRSASLALQAGGIAVVGEAVDGREAVELALRLRPDVVLMDIVMPVVDGLEATRQLAEKAPGIHVLAFTASGDESIGMMALRLGASGHLSKGIELEALPRAVEAVCRGEAAISRQMGSQLVAQLRSAPVGGQGLRPVRSPLTSREWEVLDLLIRGATSAEIAEEMVLAPDTVRSHVKAILRKMGASSRQEAVDMARAACASPPGPETFAA